MASVIAKTLEDIMHIVVGAHSPANAPLCNLSMTGLRLSHNSLTIKYVFEAVVFGILLDLVPEAPAKLTAHERVFLLALL